MKIRKCESNGRLSRVVVSGDTLYLSGMVAPAECSDIAEQTQWLTKTIEQTLQTYGSSKEDILSAAVYLRDMGDFPEMNKVWDQWFSDIIPPARTCVEAGLASPHALIEITVIAAKAEAVIH